MRELIIKKIASGRFIFTIAAAVVFTYGSLTKQLSQELIASVISTVVALYFSRNDRSTNQQEETK